MSDSNPRTPNDQLATIKQEPKGFSYDGVSSDDYQMSFDPTSKTGLVMFLKATTQDLPSIESLANQKLEVVNWLCHPAQTIDNDTGLVKSFLRIVIFDKDGNGYDCGSQGIAKSILLMEKTRGRAPWNPPFLVKVKSERLASKRLWLTLEPDMDAMIQWLSTIK